MDDRLDRLDYYTLLGVHPTAGVEEIKTAFRTFARRYHPDRYLGESPEKVERANEIYRRGTEAFQTLVDPVARRAYHKQLRQRKVRLTTDVRDRAEAEVRLSTAPPKRPMPIRTPQALAFYRRAAEEARDGDWHAAWRTLQLAREIEPGNALIEHRIEQIEAHLGHQP